MPECFAQHERIKRKTDFQRVYQEGSKRVSSSFILYSTIEQGRSYCRLGITASRKVGNAVVRNRCKRVLREIFRRHKPLLPQGMDIVVVVRRAMTEKRYHEILDEFCCALS
ncbi:ribonuclease P protein component [candidate division KSB3 bacterium]|uniref:Ribonuclease P protein component n=1 Tax=candidate division KSB3 bacterium TaxID=2044937 RepID=A0A2G6E2P3_9BACT|nr:MAG: ribonuclease P protein component [candidate division KSB3 bacterium]PIE29252.1 MAG: ribonuclease P protein component [candidate division KSB3 bacterium]